MTTPAQSVIRPPAGEIVNDVVLTSLMYSTLTLALGFSGTANPTTIWQEMIGDRQRAFTYYRELEEKDDDVGSAIEEMKLSVLRRDRQINAFDQSSDAQAVRDYVQSQFDRFDLDALVDRLLDAPFYGLAVQEIIWDVSSSEIGIADVRDCPQEAFSFNELMKPQIGPLRFMQDLIDPTGGVLVPEQKFIVCSYRPRARNRRGQPLLRKVFWPSWFKRNVQKFWVRAAEKGPGTAAVKYPQGASQDEKNKAVATAEQVINSIAVAVPENTGLITELLTQARAINPDVYAKLFQNLQYSIARRIKGETLTSFANEGQTGSRAQGEVHGETKEERSVSFCKLVEQAINDQLVRRLVLYNFGPDAPMPTFVIEKNPPQDLKGRVEIDNTLQAMGMPIPKSYIAEMYAIPEAQEGDEILVRSASATAPVQATGNIPSQFDDVHREMKDVDRLLADAEKTAQDLMRTRLAEILAEVRK